MYCCQLGGTGNRHGPWLLRPLGPPSRIYPKSGYQSLKFIFACPLWFAAHCLSSLDSFIWLLTCHLAPKCGPTTMLGGLATSREGPTLETRSCTKIKVVDTRFRRSVPSWATMKLDDWRYLRMKLTQIYEMKSGDDWPVSWQTFPIGRGKFQFCLPVKQH
jgi:hypothetical protein